MRIGILTLTAISCIHIAGIAMADSCNDILTGIYDINDTNVSSKTIYAFKNWICNEDSASASGNYLQTISGSGSWAKSRCSNSQLSKQDENQFRQIIKNVNQQVVVAWQQCMQRKGLNTAIILSDDPAKFQIVFSYVPYASSDHVATLQAGKNGLNFEGNVKCSGDWVTQKNRTIGVEGQIISCVRADISEVIPITINSSPAPNNGGLLNLAGFNPIEQNSAISLKEELFAGKPATLIFSNSACSKFNLGTIMCGYQYSAQHNKSNNQWTVTGFNKGKGSIGTWTYSNSKNAPGYVSVWGATFTFNDSGQLFKGTTNVGTIQLQN